MKLIPISLLFVILSVSGAAADTYKCRDDQGRLTFSSFPCDPAEEVVRVTPSSSDSQSRILPASTKRENEIEHEIELLTKREAKMVKELDIMRADSKKSIGHMIAAKPQIKWLQNELDSVRKQKISLLGM
jgi:hypothetical protein